MAEQAPLSYESFKRLIKIVSLGTLLLVFLGYLYRPVLLGVAASVIISYIALPFVESLCRRSPFGRRKTVVLLIVVLVALLTLLGALVLPFIYEETLHIVRMIPDALSYAESLMAPTAEWLKRSKIFPEEAIDAGLKRLTVLPELASNFITVQQIFLRTPALIEVAFNIAMIPLFSYLLLAEHDRLKLLTRKAFPEDIFPLAQTFVIKINAVLRAVVKGQFIIAFLLSVLYMIGFSIIDVPSGVAIGALAGICRIVPFLDVIVGILLCSIVIITQGSGLAVFIGAAAVIAIVQTIDGMIITPRIIGDRAGLHPIVVIASVYAFGSQFGLLGVLLAVPLVAAVYVAFRVAWPFVRQAPFFRENSHAVPLQLPEQNSAFHPEHGRKVP